MQQWTWCEKERRMCRWEFEPHSAWLDSASMSTSQKCLVFRSDYLIYVDLRHKKVPWHFLMEKTEKGFDVHEHVISTVYKSFIESVPFHITSWSSILSNAKIQFYGLFAWQKNKCDQEKQLFEWHIQTVRRKKWFSYI